MELTLVCFAWTTPRALSSQFPLASRPVSFRAAKKYSDLTLKNLLIFAEMIKKQVVSSSNRSKVFKQYTDYTILFSPVWRSLDAVP